MTDYVVTTRDGKKIHVSGDTVPFAETEEVASRYAPVDLKVVR